jgi:hypothetical protein
MMSEGSDGHSRKAPGEDKRRWQREARRTDDRLETESSKLVERDDFSAFIFGLGPEESGLETSAPLNAPLPEELNRSTLDDIFADINPQIPYQDTNLDFLSLFDTTDNRAAASVTSQNTVGSSHPSLQNAASIAARGAFPSFMMNPHPGIVIPSSTISSDTDAETSTVLPPRRPQLHSKSLSSGAIGHTPIKPDAFGSPSLEPRHVSTSPTVAQRQLRLEPWPLVPSLEAVEPSLPSLPYESDISQLQSKPTSSTIAGSSRRKSIGTSTSESPTSATRLSKTSHNMIEKRYRLKLNDKILSLRNAVPVLRASAAASEDLQPGRGIASKLNKGTVLTKATEYIQQLEHEKRQLEDEVASLKEILSAAAAQRREEDDREQNFEMGGAATAIMVDYEPFPNETGMISPESCTSLMSPEAEGTNRMIGRGYCCRKTGIETAQG